MQKNKRYILTLSCEDISAIVSSVSGFLADNHCFIIESAQLGDPSTNKFFMRTVFEITDSNGMSFKDFSANFAKIAEKFTMNWQLNDADKKLKTLIMVSKQSHCLNDLLHRYASGNLNIEIPAVISNHKDMEDMVKWHNIPFYHLPFLPNDKPRQEQQVLELIKEYDIELTVLARYMQILSPEFVNNVYGRAINIHHSFLPGFKGAKPYHQAFDRGVKIIGATAHYVSNELDEGPIIEQEVTRVSHSDTPEKLLNIGRGIESLVLSRAVKYHSEHRVLLNGNKTVVFD